MMRFASDTGNGRSSTASAKLNMAALAPTPSAIDRTAIIVNPGLLRRVREREADIAQQRSHAKSIRSMDAWGSP